MQTPSASGHVTSSGEDSDDTTSDEESGEQCSTLRKLLLWPTPTGVTNIAQPKVDSYVNEMLRVDRETSAVSSVSNPLPVLIDTVVEESVSAVNEQVKEVELVHLQRQAFETTRIRQMLPVRTMIMADSERMYPEVPHSWLCNGRLLQLHDPINPGNSNLFQV